MQNQLTNFDIITIATAAMTLVVTNTWNTLFKEVIDEYFPQNESNKAITARILYTIILTFFVGVFVYIIKTYGTELGKKIQNFIENFSLKFKIKIPKIPEVPEIPEI